MTLPVSDNTKPQASKTKAVDFGPQPLAELLAHHNLTPKDLIQSSKVQLTFKVIQKGKKGRRLTLNSKQKILFALNAATQSEYTLKDLFNYKS